MSAFTLVRLRTLWRTLHRWIGVGLAVLLDPRPSRRQPRRAGVASGRVPDRRLSGDFRGDPHGDVAARTVQPTGLGGRRDQAAGGRVRQRCPDARMTGRR
jgi:hypothetical protein